jgi:septum formation protein
MPRVILGSASPRRRRLLAEAGWIVDQRPPDIDDGELRIDAGSPEATVAALAWFKAAQLGPPDGEAIASIAADTVCAAEGRILGKPVDRADAAAMLQLMAPGRHRTLTGVCVQGRDGSRHLFVDAAIVEMDAIDPESLASYLDSGEWHDKAGGYNLADRVDAGWPIRCTGDPTTVMGLPMRRLQPMLEQLARTETPA